MTNFAIIGTAGYVAPRHLQAIRDTGSRLVAATDPSDSVGILDRYFPEARFFTEIERFDRFLEKLRRRAPGEPVEYVSICSPNYLHDAHARLALRVHASVICEKPLVISPWNLDQLAELEREYGGRISTVLQLRVHPDLLKLQAALQAESPRRRARVVLTYVTPRGPWYHVSWKGRPEKSGGLAMNIGIHFFDLLIWLFGGVEASEVHLSAHDKMAGALRLEWADVSWFLSVDRRDVPAGAKGGGAAYRSITVDGDEMNFSEGFTDLHTRVYEDVLAGGGFGIEVVRPSIELVHGIRTSPVKAGGEGRHPLAGKGA